MSEFAQDLAKLSSAEDFFTYFGVAFDARVLAACRLHILKRLHDKLACIDGLDALDDTAKRILYRQQLAHAYADFVSGPALSQGVFPRLLRQRGAFVALSSVRLPKEAARSSQP